MASSPVAYDLSPTSNKDTHKGTMLCFPELSVTELLYGTSRALSRVPHFW